MGVNAHTNFKPNGIYSPVSVSEDKKKPKTKTQLLNEQDAIPIAKDYSELNEEELQMKEKRRIGQHKELSVGIRKRN